MADWTHRINLKDLHAKSRNKEITPADLGKEVAKRIRHMLDANIPPIPEELLDEGEDIASRFESDIETLHDYDIVLSDLYDWADTPLPHGPEVPFSLTPKLCWVNTL